MASYMIEVSYTAASLKTTALLSIDEGLAALEKAGTSGYTPIGRLALKCQAWFGLKGQTASVFRPRSG